MAQMSNNQANIPVQQSYDPSQGNGMHMPPPPVPPLNIPTNGSAVPSALSADDAGVLSPSGSGIRRAAPEPNKRALYVGGLDARVTEEVLKQIFETAGHVQSVKIIPDKNVSSPFACIPYARRRVFGSAWVSTGSCLRNDSLAFTFNASASCKLNAPLTFTFTHADRHGTGQGLQLWLRRVRRPSCRRESNVIPQWTSRAQHCKPTVLSLNLATHTLKGDQSQLGLSIQHNLQGRHLQPFPHLCRRPIQRGQRRSPAPSFFHLWSGLRGPRHVGYENWSLPWLRLCCFPRPRRGRQGSVFHGR